MSHDLSVFTKENLEPILKRAKLLFANAEEVDYIQSLYGYKDITDLFSLGQTEIIVKTLGKDGSLVYEKTDAGPIVHPIPITPSGTNDIKAVGAGDAYVAGFLYGFSQGADLVTCAQYGSTVSSFVIETDGSVSSAPTLEQMLKRNALRPDAADHAAT